MEHTPWVAIVAGILQGIFEWLPISSEGNFTVVLSWLGRSPEQAVAFALFLYLGTACSATLYYRHTITDELATAATWRPRHATAGAYRRTTFFGVATVVPGIVGLLAYSLLAELVSALTGGAIVIATGLLLVATGVFQRLLTTTDRTATKPPMVGDALLVGLAQGIAILPGVSRSGTTTGVLLLRGHDETAAFQLSFLLSIPAAVGGGLLAVTETGLGGLSVTAGVTALVVATVVGYLTIDALMTVVERLAFWGVCVGLGGLAILGGVHVF